MIIDKLYELVKERGPVCIGLDTRLDYLPDSIACKQDISIADKLFLFNKAIIDNTSDITACYKVQIACYEAHGILGLQAYQKTLAHIRKKENIVIADVKRGDIFSTAQEYAQGHFSGDFEADFLTINPYMGLDAIEPYFPYLDNGEKGLFILAKTSNPSSQDFQELVVEGQPLYLHVARKIEEWGEKFRGKYNYSTIGAVVGLTYPEEFIKIKNVARHTFFLIPGYGAQGGTGKDFSRIFKNNINAVINSSRGIIAAHKGLDETDNFVTITREKVLKMKKDISQWR
ncbi:MAG: orotidine-5'-phosphate decarboxylase [Atribacterota bacterium]|nr:orotidine-5'-phosphate decarboxylase [Atribacterota bacterium]